MKKCTSISVEKHYYMTKAIFQSLPLFIDKFLSKFLVFSTIYLKYILFVDKIPIQDKNIIKEKTQDEREGIWFF